MAAITCGKCKATHEAVASVRACYDDRLFPCNWLVERPAPWYYDEETGESWGGEDGPVIEDCGADAIVTDRGFTCSAGHGHVYAEIRNAEGWEYAEDADEAKRLARAGVEPRDLVTAGAFRY